MQHSRQSYGNRMGMGGSLKLKLALATLVGEYDLAMRDIQSNYENMTETGLDLQSNYLAKYPTQSLDQSLVSHDPMVTLLDDAFVSLTKTLAGLESEKTLVQELHRMAQSGEKTLDAFEARLSTTSHPVENSREYREFRKALFEVYFPNAPFGLDMDQDIQVMSEALDYYCPITRMVMNDPYTCSVCNHSFSSAIVDIVRLNGRYACPIPGCNHVILPSQLVKDPAIARKVKRWLETRDE